MYQIDLQKLPQALREGLIPIMVAHTTLMTSSALASALEGILAIARVNEAKAQVLDHPDGVIGYCRGVPSLPALAWLRSQSPRGTPASVANDLADAICDGIKILRGATDDPEGHRAVIKWLETDLAQLCHRAFCFNTALRTESPKAGSQPRLKVVR